MSLERVIVVGNQHKTQDMIRPFVKNLFSADSLEDTMDVLESVEPDMVVIDEMVPLKATEAFIKKTNEKYEGLNVLPILKTNDQKNSAALIEAGAFDCIGGPDDYNRLSRIVDKIKFSHPRSEKEDLFFAEDCPGSVSIVGKSSALKRTLKMIKIVAKSDCNPVLIVGETGTGKELAAKAVHITRHGSGAKFVAVNCAALTANLLESELFGHTKGSFTSAESERTFTIGWQYFLLA